MPESTAGIVVIVAMVRARKSGKDWIEGHWMVASVGNSRGG